MSLQLSETAKGLLVKAVSIEGLIFSRQDIGVEDDSPIELITAWGELTSAGFVAPTPGQQNGTLTITSAGQAALKL